MSESLTGIVMIGVPILFNVGFAMLAQRFDYPDILRQPTHEVLERFRAGGSARCPDLVGVRALRGSLRAARRPAGRSRWPAPTAI